MRLLATAAFICSAVGLALLPAAVALHAEMHPDDSARSEALATCAESDPGFNRWLAAARRACFDRQLGLNPARSGQPAPAASGHFLGIG